MISRTNAILAGLLVLTLLMTSIARVDYSKPNFEVLPDMKYTPAWTAFSENPNFANGRTMQAPVPGTIARGAMPLHYSASKEDAIRAGEELLNPFAIDVVDVEVAAGDSTNVVEDPLAVSSELLSGSTVPQQPDETRPTKEEQRQSIAQSRRVASIARGGETYRVFCISCHGPKGLGDGPVTQRGFPPPPSLLTGKSNQMKDGQLFHILSYGQGSMASFAAQLTHQRRWDVINYIRDLQSNAPKAEPDATPAPASETPPKDAATQDAATQGRSNKGRSMTANSLAKRNNMRLLQRSAIVGGAVLAVGLAIAPDRVSSNLLLAAFYLITLALGGALFMALTYVTGAGWHVAFRRIPEAMAATLPVFGVAMLIVLVSRMENYGWHHHGEGDAGTFWFKELWLTPQFWAIRAVTYVFIWTLLARLLVSRSRKQDHSGNVALTGGSVRLSAFFLAIYAITFSLATIDWIMALEPMWFSTIWGVYQFSGMTQAALAVIIILGLVLRAGDGPLRGVFNDEHLHDLGKLLLGFSCFWMYIWFSQYMLIWYTNIPEETTYFILRMQGPWGPVVAASIVLNWLVPFFVLLPRSAKRSGSVMMKVAVVVLIGRWIDLYVMIFPPTIGEVPVFGLWEVASICLLVGAGGFLFLRSFAAANPVPRQDPYVNESRHYHAG